MQNWDDELRGAVLKNCLITRVEGQMWRQNNLTTDFECFGGDSSKASAPVWVFYKENIRFGAINKKEVSIL